MLLREQVTLGILAGGRASRLGGRDKAFEDFRGDSLLTRTRAALGPGFAQELVSYNGGPERLQGVGLSPVADRRPDFPGPLAGLEAMLRECTQPWLLSLPVDLRDIPGNLFDQLAYCHSRGRADAGVVVVDADGLQPLVALWPRECASLVSRALDSGNHAARDLLRDIGFRQCDISPSRLGNLNSPADFE